MGKMSREKGKRDSILFAGRSRGGRDGRYGRVRDHGVMRQAHVVAFERAHGVVPTGCEVDHTCGNPLCINPAHLEAVSPTENKRRSSATKLCAEDVAEIRRAADEELQRRVARGFRRRSLGWIQAMASRHGVTPRNVKAIIRGDSWAA